MKNEKKENHQPLSLSNPTQPLFLFPKFSTLRIWVSQSFSVLIYVRDLFSFQGKGNDNLAETAPAAAVTEAPRQCHRC